MFRKKVLYSKLKLFFDQSYIHSFEENILMDLEDEIDLKRYVSSLNFRFEYQNKQLCFYDGITWSWDPYKLRYDIIFYKDIFTNRVFEKLWFCGLDVTTLNGISVLLEFYHDYYSQYIKRNIKEINEEKSHDVD